MRAALWLLGLFGLAVAGAWLASHNDGSVSFFLHPWRLDLSLNLVLLLVLTVLAVLWLAQKALSTLWALPREARRWRLQQKERAAHTALLEACGQFLSGRYLRARKLAESVVALESAWRQSADQAWAHAPALRTAAHWVAAESAHALQDGASRSLHLQQALDEAQAATPTERAIWHEGLSLRAARWALDDRDPQSSLQQLAQLPSAAARRTVALRIALKAARLGGQTERALETAMLLAKHRAFSPSAAQSLVRSLLLDRIQGCSDAVALQRLWGGLPRTLTAWPDVAATACLQGLQLGWPSEQARACLLAAWDSGAQFAAPQGPAWVRWAQALEASWTDGPSSDARAWLARLESAQQGRPQDPWLQYVAGTACWHQQLWGKAQSLLGASVRQLGDAPLLRRAWSRLAQMAEQRQDSAAALQAYQQLAQLID